MPSTEVLLERLTLLPLLILSLTVHEWAHAWSAWRLGDDTANGQGRMTLNPLVHIDLLGTIVLPLLSPIPFGWAKPVPVDPARFRRTVSMSGGMALTASAGPLANLLLALVAAVAIGLGFRFLPGELQNSPVLMLLVQMLRLNVALAVFNMLPVPPLDGSRIVAWLVPPSMTDTWRQVESFAPLFLIAVLLWGSRLAAGPISAVYRQLENLIYLIA